MRKATYKLWGTNGYIVVSGRQVWLDNGLLPYRPYRISRATAAQYLAVHRLLAPGR
jgi:hypothetical protein